MKRIPTILFCGAILSLVFLGIAIADEEGHGKHDQHGKEGIHEDVSLTGEVIDIACYSAHPENGQGPGHADCAKTCAKIGLPVGLLEKETKKVYLAVMSNHKSANETLLPHMAEQVTLKGTVHETKGVNVIHIDSIEPEKK